MVENSGHIFLSYRSSEVDFALRLAADLKNAGVNLWMDRLDIRPGDDWGQALQDGVDRCVALIAVISPEYAHSKYCKRELARADKAGRLIFPVLLRATKQSDWPMELERRQYIDFTGWLDDKLYQTQLTRLVNVLKNKLAEQISEAPDPETRYLNTLIAELETSRGVLGLPVDTAASSDDPTRPPPVQARTWSMHGRFAIAQAPASQPENHHILPPLPYRLPLSTIYEAVERHPRFVLVGAPSSGKSMTLNHLALDAARAHRAAPRINPLPLVIRLAAWGDQTSLPDFIRANWPLDTDPLRLIAKGKVALYLDGLSEMTGAVAAKAKRLRDWMHGDQAPQRIIVTCRTEDYSDALDLGLPVVQAIELDASHIQEFVAHYLDAEAAARLLAHLEPPAKTAEADGPTTGTHHLHQMARNPFLLSALIIMSQQSPEGDLPRNPGLLVRQLVSALWERAGSRRTSQALSFEELEVALVDLAFAMADNHMPVYMPLDEAMEHIGDRKLLQAGLSAGFIEMDGDHVRFTHHYIQAYFAALGLQRVGLPTRLTKPQIDSQFQRVGRKWDQAMLMLAAISPNPDAVILNIADVDPYLALECAVGGVPLDELTYRQVVKRMLNTMRQDGDWRVTLAKIMMQVDPSTSTSILLETLRDGAWSVRLAAAAALREIDAPRLPGLAQALGDLSEDNRERTALALRQMSKTVLPTLLQLLRDDNRKMRRGAAWALGELKDKAAVPALLEALNESDHLVSTEAVIALGRIRDVAAVNWLLGAFHHDNWRVRKAASVAVARIGKPSITGLHAILRDENASVRRLAVESLAQINDAEAAPALLEATYDENVEVRSTAVEGLRGFGGPPVIRRLIECLNDTEKSRNSKHRICDLAAALLEKSGDEGLAAVEQWRSGETPRKSGRSPRTAKERLQEDRDREHGRAGVATADGDEADPDWTVRRDAVVSLVHTDAAVAVPRLRKALLDEDSQVRIAAIKTLAAFPDRPTVMEALIGALADEEPVVCDAATEALKVVARPPSPGLTDALHSPNRNVRAAAANVLGFIRDESAVPDLMDCLTDLDKPWLDTERICDKAARALENIGTPEALEALVQWRGPKLPVGMPEPLPLDPPQPPVNHPDAQVAEHRDILSELMHSLHSQDWAARQDAAQALREYAKALHQAKEPQIVARLVAGLEDPDWSVRWAMSEALAWIGDAAAVTALLGHISDANWTVRVAAIRALMHIGDAAATEGLSAAVGDRNHLAREAVAEALGALADPRGIPALEKLAADEEEFVRLAAVIALSKIGTMAAAAPVLKALGDVSPHVRWAAASGLSTIATADNVPQLLPSLEDYDCPYWENWRICDLIADVLEHIGTVEAQAAVAAWRRSQTAAEER